jgi:hypothetical protein
LLQIFSRRNYLGETRKQALHRRVTALEIHIRDLEGRHADLANSLTIHEATPLTGTVMAHRPVADKEPDPE